MIDNRAETPNNINMCLINTSNVSQKHHYISTVNFY